MPRINKKICNFFTLKPSLVSEKLAAVRFAFLPFLTMFPLRTLCLKTLFTETNFKGWDSEVALLAVYVCGPVIVENRDEYRNSINKVLKIAIQGFHQSNKLCYFPIR